MARRNIVGFELDSLDTDYEIYSYGTGGTGVVATGIAQAKYFKGVGAETRGIAGADTAYLTIGGLATTGKKAILNAASCYFRAYMKVVSHGIGAFQSEPFLAVLHTNATTTNRKMHARLYDTGRVSIIDSVGVSATSAVTDILTVGKWHRIEVYITTGVIGATITLKVDGSTYCTGAAFNTTANNTSVLCLGKLYNNSNCYVRYYWDDVVIDDGAWIGASEQRLLVGSRTPEKDEWTGSVSDLLENYPINTALYKSSSSNSEIQHVRPESAYHAGLAGTILCVKGLAAGTDPVALPSAGGRVRIWGPDGTDESSADAVFNDTTPEFLAVLSEVNPRTSTAWTRDQLKQVEVGLRKTQVRQWRMFYSALEVESTPAIDDGASHVLLPGELVERHVVQWVADTSGEAYVDIYLNGIINRVVTAPSPVVAPTSNYDVYLIQLRQEWSGTSGTDALEGDCENRSATVVQHVFPENAVTGGMETLLFVKGWHRLYVKNAGAHASGTVVLYSIPPSVYERRENAFVPLEPPTAHWPDALEKFL